MDRDGGDAQFLGGAQDAQGDLAPVGDEDLIEPVAGRSPCISITVPARGARISLKVFMASTSSSLSPAFTTLPISTNGLLSGLWRR